MPRLTEKFLESIADVIEVFSCENSSYFSPPIALLTAVVLTSTASFSNKIASQIPLIIYSIVLSQLLKIKIKYLIKPITFVIIIASISALPLIFITPGQTISRLNGLAITDKGLFTAVSLIARSATASLTFTVITLSLGWRGIIEALRELKIPNSLIMSLNLFIKYMPIFLREICSLLVAREARIMRKNQYKLAWIVMATSSGDLLLRASQRAWKLQNAMQARLLNAEIKWNQRKTKRKWFTIRDLGLIITTCIVIISSIYVGGALNC